jgi:predicted protein tyrosine phosphatase
MQCRPLDWEHRELDRDTQRGDHSCGGEVVASFACRMECRWALSLPPPPTASMHTHTHTRAHSPAPPHAPCLQTVLATDMQGLLALVPPTCRHLKLPLNDEPSEDLLRHLPMAVGFIGGALSEGGRVLVHCFAGMSRSASVVIAYLMKARGFSAHEGFRVLKAKHRNARPNAGRCG